MGAAATYMTGRKKYARPQAVLFANNPGEIDGGLWVPQGDEWIDFIILTDHNRQEIRVGTQRMEKRERMINGRLRSYWLTDKKTLNLSWDTVPSRAYDKVPEYDETGKITNGAKPITVDGGAGGSEILDWYNNTTGEFYVFLAYDNYRVFGTGDDAYDHLGQYNDVSLYYFTQFEHTVKKRGGTNFDLWSLSMALEEA